MWIIAHDPLPGLLFLPSPFRLGSVRVVTDGAGVERDRIGYTAFGAVAWETGGADWGGRFRYTGQEWVAGLDMQRHHWRWFDTTAGQWTTEDPLGFGAGDANLRRYVANGPTNATDPTGLTLVAWDQTSAQAYLSWLSGEATGAVEKRWGRGLGIEGLSVQQAYSGRWVFSYTPEAARKIESLLEDKSLDDSDRRALAALISASTNREVQYGTVLQRTPNFKIISGVTVAISEPGLHPPMRPKLRTSFAGQEGLAC